MNNKNNQKEFISIIIKAIIYIFYKLNIVLIDGWKKILDIFEITNLETNLFYEINLWKKNNKISYIIFPRIEKNDNT